MKKTILAAVLLSFVAGAGAADLKIAVVDPMQAISETKQAKKLIADLEKELGSERGQLVKLEGELKSCEQKMKTDSATMSTTALAKFRAECETKYREYQNLGQSMQKIVSERQQSIMNELAPRFQAALAAIVKESGYEMIVQREAMLHFNPNFDITTKVTSKMDSTAK